MNKTIKLNEAQLKEMIGSILMEYTQQTRDWQRHDAKYTPQCYYNCPDIHFIWHGETADPELEYNGKYVDYYDIDDWMCELAKENNIQPDTIEYSLMVQDYCDDIKRYIDEHGQSDEEETIGESKKRLNEAESDGWVVETEDVDDAYKLAVQEWGEDETNAMIVRCLGYTPMAECLAYIFRMNDFRKWDEYKARKTEGDDEEDMM